MKNIIVSIIIAIGFIFMGMDAFCMKVDLGGKMGIGAGWWRGSEYTKNIDTTGAFNATMGVYTSFELHKYVAMQFELLFATIGNNDELKYKNYKLERSFRNTAFELPVYVKPKFELGLGEMFFLLGPKFLILLDDFKVNTKASISNVSHESELDYRIGRQFHLGLTLGIGYEFKVGPGKLQFSLNVTPYLTNYGKGYSDAVQNEAYLDVGYAYTFGKK